MTTELFTNIPPSNPTALQSARIALADAERERDLALYADEHDITDLDRAVNRFAELVKTLELKQLEGLK